MSVQRVCVRESGIDLKDSKVVEAVHESEVWKNHESELRGLRVIAG